MSEDEQRRVRDVPDDPRNDPEATVDALEERALGGRDEQVREGEDEEPAIEQDLDEEDLGEASSEPAD